MTRHVLSCSPTPGHRAVVLDRSKRWAGRFLARPTCRRMLLRNMAATCRTNDPLWKVVVSGYMRRRGGSAGLRPAPAEAEAKAAATARATAGSGLSVGWAGRCGLAGHAVNPSLGARWRHPWRQRSCQPTPPRPRQISGDGRLIHALRGSNSSKSNISIVHRRASTYGVDLPCRPRSTPTRSTPCHSSRSQETVEGGVGPVAGA
jgi:hypothetical protein